MPGIVFHLLVDFGVVSEGIVLEVVLGGLDDDEGLDAEGETHDQRKGRKVSVHELSVVVHHDSPVGKCLESKVGDHFPHGEASSEALVLEALSLVEPLSVFGAISVFVTVGENHGNKKFSERNTLSVNGTFIIEVTSTHQQGTHDWKDAVEIHKVFGAVKVGQIVGVAFNDDSAVVEVVFLSVHHLEEAGDSDQGTDDGLPVRLEGLNGAAEDLGIRS
mmetsp:Transcript_2856/g.7754  ORF Transcript_2856/g.7754 Transcript_2856/m.7754 type:complete len:218 (+) Transcript_2856:1507-2160(+)